MLLGEASLYLSSCDLVSLLGAIPFTTVERILLVMRGVRVWQNRQMATTKARRKGRGRQSLRHLGTCPQTMASSPSSLCPLPHCRCRTSSCDLSKADFTQNQQESCLFLLLSAFVVPGKKPQVSEEQRLRQFHPMQVQEQPVKKQEVSSSKQQHAMGCSARSRSQLFHTTLSGKQTCWRTGEEQESSPTLQEELRSRTIASKKARA